MNLRKWKIDRVIAVDPIDGEEVIKDTYYVHQFQDDDGPFYFTGNISFVSILSFIEVAKDERTCYFKIRELYEYLST